MQASVLVIFPSPFKSAYFFTVASIGYPASEFAESCKQIRASLESNFPSALRSPTIFSFSGLAKPAIFVYVFWVVVLSEDTGELPI